MPHYKPVDYSQTKLLPVNYSEQLIEGTFEHALNCLVEDELDQTNTFASEIQDLMSKIAIE